MIRKGLRKHAVYILVLPVLALFAGSGIVFFCLSLVRWAAHTGGKALSG